jgi:16S rRNA (guanine966-N2)-methyltransferase
MGVGEQRVRVVAGRWKGRGIDAPKGTATRPTSDRVREAVFSAIDARIGTLAGTSVLDLYAGSGALGIEALSRGAVHVDFVESDRGAASVIRRNLDNLGAAANEYDIHTQPVERFVARRRTVRPVSLLLADPPYRIDAALFHQVLEALAGSGLIARGALVVYEHAADAASVWPEGFADDGFRRYGDTAVSYAVYEG